MPRGSVACATAKPIAASKLDGSIIQEVLEDEDGLKEVAEALFGNLDVDEDGKISRSELEPALLQVGYGLGVPTPGRKESLVCLQFQTMSILELSVIQCSGQTAFCLSPTCTFLQMSLRVKQF